MIVGVSRYKHLPPGAQLQYPDNDAEEIARFLRSPQGGSLDATHMRALTNENATVAAIRGALNTWLPRCQATGLENTGQECIGDCVQSTAGGLKRPMLLRSVESFAQLRKLRPTDASLEVKEQFCLARAQIAAGDFAAAVENLQSVLRIDAGFAGAYNALGVAYARLGKARESLLHACRIANRDTDFDRQAREALALDPNYAPTYLDIGSYFESRQDFARAA